MRTTLFSILFFLGVHFIQAQVWAPTGATWHYDYAQMWVNGYVKIQYTGDTTIAGKVCKILKKELYTYNYMSNTYSSGVLGYEYTYMENSVVYYRRFGNFFKLYDFNATASNTWTVAGWDPPVCDSTGTLVVDSTGMTSINGFSLKTLYTSQAPNNYWGFGSYEVIERIGSLGYMFPEPTCVVDISEGGPLRCYYDNTFGLYQRAGFPPACDYITGIDPVQSRDQMVKTYPIPTSSSITIDFSTMRKEIRNIELSDLLGNRLKMMHTEKQKVVMNVVDLKDGIYFIKISNDSGESQVRKIFKSAF
ncbi:MAG: T9SS type A sorting domain-containing protein [Bacteroidota bacterium]